MLPLRRAMKRSTRNDIAAAVAAIAFTSFLTHLWQFSRYFSVRPAHPDRALGLVWPLYNHGAVVYLSAVESTGLALLFYVFMLGIVLVAAVIPKEYQVLPEGSPHWHSYVRGNYRTDPYEPRRLLVMAISAVAYLAIVWGFGTSIAGFVVAEGLVLHM
jgi:hypothetical protein